MHGSAATVKHSARAAALARSAMGAPSELDADDATRAATHDAAASETRVVELLVVALDDARAADDGSLYLFALLANDELLLYRAFRCVLEARVDARLLPVRWSRVESRFLRRQFRVRDDEPLDASALVERDRVSQMVPLGVVNGIACVVVGGVRPIFLMHLRGALRVYPIWLADGVRANAVYVCER
jgi:hypothetical protein